MTARTPPPGGTGPAPASLLAVAGDPRQASRAVAEGADMIDVTGASAEAAAVIREQHPATTLWAGAAPGTVDADLLAAGPDAQAGDAPVAAVVAVTAVSTWLGAQVIRTRHVRQARRAIDMTLSIAGKRAPACTTRGLG